MKHVVRTWQLSTFAFRSVPNTQQKLLTCVYAPLIIAAPISSWSASKSRTPDALLNQAQFSCLGRLLVRKEVNIQQTRKYNLKPSLLDSIQSTGSIRCYTTQKRSFGELTQQAWKTHPNRFKPLTPTKISTILGPKLSCDTGNRLLQTLQMHRIMGTLDHEIEIPGVNGALAAKALEWLRTNYPFDEDAAIMMRIEAEERMMEEEFIAKAEKLKLYKPQQSAEEEGIYGKSHFETMRKINEEEAERLKRLKEDAEANESSGDSALIQRPAGRAVLTRRTESADWVKAYKEKAQLSKLLEPEQISKTRRLLPSAIFTVTFIGLCVFFAQNYEAPIRQARLFPETPPAAATIFGIMSINIMMFVVWRLPFCWRVMNKYFLLGPSTPQPLSLLGNAFSHQSPAHLCANMLFLWLLGTRCRYLYLVLTLV